MVDTMKDQARGSTPGRRHHDRAFKNDLIAQSLVPGASVAAIAMRGGINANLLFKWRREHARSALVAPSASTLLPVCVIPDVEKPPRALPVAAGHAVAPGNSDLHAGVIEIEIPGAQLRVRVRVDAATLSGVLRALRQTA